MKKGKIYLYSLIAGSFVWLSACSGKLQTYNLDEEYATSLHYQPPKEGEEPKEEEDPESNLVGVPARSFYGGDLKRGGIWWAGKGITLEKGDEFIFEVTHVGPDSTPQGATNPAIDLNTHPFGATFPPIDLIKEEVVLKISARAEGKDGSEPTLYLQFDDANGYQANAKRPAHKILNSAEYQDYYFDLKDIFAQSTPTKHKVNGALINSLKFFINPGEEPGYTGNLYIREIRIVPAPKN